MKPDDRSTPLSRFVTNLSDVPTVPGLKREDGWVDMRAQFHIEKANAGSGD